jgi:hypothetical protein
MVSSSFDFSQAWGTGKELKAVDLVLAFEGEHLSL